MSSLITNYRKICGIIFLAVGLAILFNPERAEPYFAVIISTIAIVVGCLFIINLITRKNAAKKRKILNGVVAVILIILGIIMLVMDLNPMFVAFIMSGLCIALGLERLAYYEKRKEADAKTLIPVLHGFIYWAFAVSFSYNSGVQEMAGLIRMGAFFLIMLAVLWLVSVFVLKEE